MHRFRQFLVFFFFFFFFFFLFLLLLLLAPAPAPPPPPPPLLLLGDQKSQNHVVGYYGLRIPLTVKGILSLYSFGKLAWRTEV